VNGSSEKVVANWEEIKKAERATQGKQRDSLLDGVPRNLSALMTAYKYTAKAAKVGFDWADVAGVEDKLREELAEIFAETDPQKKIREIGDLMFVLVNWLRWLNVDDPESLMREINTKFYRRFRYIETHATKPLTDMTLAEMDALWDAGKAEGL
jgi:MazG family protein